jgi:hypothetical protein
MSNDTSRGKCPALPHAPTSGSGRNGVIHRSKPHHKRMRRIQSESRKRNRGSR